MENFLQKQFKKEKEAAGRVWRSYLKLIIIFWGFMGIVLLFSSAWLVGIIFIAAAAYTLYRTKPKSQK